MTAAIKMHVKKGDTVLVLSGKDKGKEGKIIEVLGHKDDPRVDILSIVNAIQNRLRLIPKAASLLKKLLLLLPK
jgi:large subunit ribosomal protein L24